MAAMTADLDTLHDFLVEECGSLDDAFDALSLSERRGDGAEARMSRAKLTPHEWAAGLKPARINSREKSN